MTSKERRRLVRLTARYLGAPFDASCGDGPGSDLDRRPMDNWSHFDCLTYVEAVLTHHLAATPSTRLEVLCRMRYRRKPYGFTNRNHFIKYDWLTNGVTRRFLRNVTALVFGESALRARTWRHCYRRWLLRAATELDLGEQTDEIIQRLNGRLPPNGMRESTHRIMPLIGLCGQDRRMGTDGWRALSNMPSGTLLAFLGRRGEHLAFLIRHRNKVLLRHACELRRAVRDDDLARFIARHSSLGYFDGIELFTIDASK